MKLVLMTNDGKVIDSYEDIEEYDLNDPDSPFGLITWVRKSVKKGLPMENKSCIIGGVCLTCGELDTDCECVRA